MKKLVTCLFVFLMFGLITDISAQKRTVTGQVISADDSSPLPGVTVKVKGTNRGTVTNADGNYEISIPDNNVVLVFSFIGYQNKEIAVGNQSEIDVTLQQSVEELGDVVVTALGIERDRKKLGYSVQGISEENITSAPDFNIVNSLSGKIAGVQVTNSGSQVGASSRITIRGNSSFSGNQPLFVVDGVPIDNSTSNLSGIGGVDYGNAASDISPENIESITVLKGANAAALYGSRASNGAIIIETKKGRTSGVSVDFSSSVVVDKAAYFPAYQNEYGGGNRGSEFEYQRYLDENPGSNLTYNEYAKQFSYNYVDGKGGGVNDGGSTSWGPRLDAGLTLDQWATGPDSPYRSRSDNVKNFFETGTSYINNIGISAQEGIASGRLSVNNRNTSGILHNTDMEQTNISGNLTLDPSDRFTASTSFTYVNKQSDNLPWSGYGWTGRAGFTWSMTSFAWGPRNLPISELRDVHEDDFNGHMFPNSNNPFASYHIYTQALNRDRVYGNVTLQFDLLDWISLKARTGLDFYGETQDEVTTSEDKGFQRSGIGGQFRLRDQKRKELNVDLMAEFTKNITESIQIDGILGAHLRRENLDSQTIGANDLTVPDLFTVSNVNGTPVTGQYEQEQEVQSLYSSVNLSYQDYLFLGVTGRNDWSSTLPANNRSYFYPSLSLGFSITEAFNIESDKFTYGQLRGSWARVGSDTSPYQLNRTYSAGSFNNVSIFNPSSTLPPINLKPEQTTSYEVGAELRFFGDRLGLDITYYDQITEDQILRVPTPTSSGYSSRLLNAAEIQNSGIELIVNGNIVQSIEPGGFEWDATVNYAKNKNIVNELYEGLETIQISPGFGGARSLGVPGEEWGAIYGIPFVRNDEGKIVVGSDGLPATTNEAQKLGNVTPDWTGGIRNSFRYKRASLSFLVDFKMGGDIFSTTAWHSYPTGAYKVTTKNNVREEGLVFDGFRFSDGAVKEDGSPNDIRVSAQDFFNGSWVWNNHEYSIIDASYIKLRELNIGYSFNVSGIDWLSQLNLSAYGRNLAILYRSDYMKEFMLDPEVQLGGGVRGVGFENFQIPTARTFGFKVNVRY